ncbi:gas vesicle protein K [Anthocerotibacter panamensis]|uniref:gas vesicle protein K n=1 Tax=Anthocerotibacter panamensis TaxID=2857077 RepID=UPI001C4087C9|nr:gas vesicle protein K [Anthocerotibacter panamensis]
MPEGLPAAESKPNAGLAPLILTLVELIRQLLEAQVIRQIEADHLSETQINRAAESLQALEAQVLQLCEILDVDPSQLNIDLGEAGKLLPDKGGYYPGQPCTQGSILELLDRLITTGVAVEGALDLGIAGLDLIHARLLLLLTTHPRAQRP